LFADHGWWGPGRMHEVWEIWRHRLNAWRLRWRQQCLLGGGRVLQTQKHKIITKSEKIQPEYTQFAQVFPASWHSDCLKLLWTGPVETLRKLSTTWLPNVCVKHLWGYIIPWTENLTQEPSSVFSERSSTAILIPVLYWKYNPVTFWWWHKYLFYYLLMVPLLKCFRHSSQSFWFP
jgi:hypothetical protein